MKKARKGKLVAACMCAAALTVAAVGGTFAYLQDTDSDVNVMTLGNVQIEQIEQEWSADGTTLVDFTQAKPLYPYVGEMGWNKAPGDAGAETRQFTMENVVDKYVSVKNTGESDAYVRTIFAFEMGGYSYNEFNMVGISTNAEDGDQFDFEGAWNWVDEGEATIDGKKYNVMSAVHKAAVKPGAATIPSLLQVYLSKDATNEVVEKLDGNGNGTYDILVMSQAVQTTGFADAQTALDTAFGDISADNHPWMKAEFFNVSDDASLEDALKNEDATMIVVNLEEDVTFDVAAWQNDAMGGAVTEKIVINGNGHTITFNQTNSDWNNITTNGATLVINNAKVTNAGHNNGPWNRHDLNFACDVEMNDVTSDKAFAFKANAVLNNVTIDDANTSDTYAIWIQPNGQTVTLSGCTIDMIDCTDGRGIKIDEQYVSAPEKVTLEVANTVFKTEEKSAILVKSVAGADIVLSNVNIQEVAADSTNPVWVDEASASYADLVTVTGGSKIVEP